MLQIRSAEPADLDALAQVFFQAVREGARGVYSKAQCRAWCPAVPERAVWAERLAGSDVLVAEVDGKIAGFMTLIAARGFLDMAFVAPAFGRQGVGAALLSVLEGRARAAGLTRLETEASLLLEPLLVRQGWRVVTRQEVKRRGEVLRNAKMAKDLVLDRGHS